MSSSSTTERVLLRSLPCSYGAGAGTCGIVSDEFTERGPPSPLFGSGGWVVGTGDCRPAVKRFRSLTSECGRKRHPRSLPSCSPRFVNLRVRCLRTPGTSVRAGTLPGRVLHVPHALVGARAFRQRTVETGGNDTRREVGRPCPPAGPQVGNCGVRFRRRFARRAPRATRFIDLPSLLACRRGFRHSLRVARMSLSIPSTSVFPLNGSLTASPRRRTDGEGRRAASLRLNETIVQPSPSTQPPSARSCFLPAPYRRISTSWASAARSGVQRTQARLRGWPLRSIPTRPKRSLVIMVQANTTASKRTRPFVAQ